MTFDDDVAFLAEHTDVKVLEQASGGRIAVSAKYQGRVMTSAVAPGGASLGFLHRSFIASGKTGTSFDNYGGEDRFWLGPEGGQMGLYFAPGKPFAFAEWQTPHELQEGSWELAAAGAANLDFTHRLHVQNWSGTAFTVDVARAIRLLGPGDVASHLGMPIPAGLAWVAYESRNTITNAGANAWADATGLPSIWILGMFAPAADARIVIPFDPAGEGPIVNDRYFGKVPAERLSVHDRDGYLVLSADGNYRSKIGVGPGRARNVAGSYSPSQELLTIVQYDEAPRGKRYVNSMWEMQKDPYAGDVINAYNDGPTAPGKPSLGGFYELETSSPAAALAPQAATMHVHRTLHFVGARDVLDPIARRALGVSLDALSAR
jgi:hypothetical protein